MEEILHLVHSRLDHSRLVLLSVLDHSRLVLDHSRLVLDQSLVHLIVQGQMVTNQVFQLILALEAHAVLDHSRLVLLIVLDHSRLVHSRLVQMSRLKRYMSQNHLVLLSVQILVLLSVLDHSRLVLVLLIVQCLILGAFHLNQRVLPPLELSLRKLGLELEELQV